MPVAKRLSFLKVFFAVGVCLGLAAPAHAQSVEAELERAYARCRPQLGIVALPHPADPSDFGHDQSFTRDAGDFIIRDGYSGNGVEAMHGGTIERFAPADCARLIVHHVTGDGMGRVAVRVERHGSIDDGPAAVASLFTGPTSAARPGDPDHAFARAWLQHPVALGPGPACGAPTTGATGAWVLGDAVAEAQPWHAGRPRRSGWTYWDEAALRAIGISVEGGFGELLDEVSGFLVPGVRRARRVLRVGALELWEAPALNGRNPARALAIYDRRQDRHRWVLVTRGCVSGSRLVFHDHDRRFVVGQTHNRHPAYEMLDTQFVIDVTGGVAFPVFQRCRHGGAEHGCFDEPRVRVPLSALPSRVSP